MSFADIINQEQKRLDAQGGGNNDKVEYPETKHKRLFFDKNNKDLFMQVLPSADLFSAFAEPVRKVFLTAKSSQGKDINSNFTLDADFNSGSLLDNKLVEWADKGMIPNGFGGQTTARRFYLVNVVQVVSINGQYVQERDAQGNLVVRAFEMPQSGYANLLRKLADPLYNTSGTELSFMDINKPALVKISKPAKGQMEYPVEVYTAVTLPPLGQGWENQLENLKALAVPTERLVNGDKWVQAFVDMKEGRKPNQNGAAQPEMPQQPMANPYGTMPQQPAYPQQNAYPQQPMVPQQPMTPQQPMQQQYQPQQPTYPQQPQQPVMPQQPMMPQQPVMPQQPQYQQPMAPQDSLDGYVEEHNPYDSVAPTQPQPNMPSVQPNTPVAPQQPSQPMGGAPQQPPAPNTPAHNVGANGNGLMDIDAMLAKELGSDNV